jgi:uncharacterized SAM-binding protein YcdF (DUF218 family)/glycosyltransferase involved in cell wall biosynthesis
LLTGHDILCISSIDWRFIWQGHQEIMSTLAANGNRVLFIENTGIRTPTIRDLPRLRQRFRNWWRGTKGFQREGENLFIYSPLLLPFPYSWISRQINRRLVTRSLQRWMRATGFRRPVVWTFLPTPLARDIIRNVDPLLTIYYCIDDFASSSSGARRIWRWEERLFREADLVFVTSAKLLARANSFRQQVHLFPFGVSYQKFERVRDHVPNTDSALKHLQRPLIGYVGGIHRWVDTKLLKSLAELMPYASFALVGPVQADASDLEACPNVHLLGAQAHEDIPKYIGSFDVGIVPYLRSDYTDNVYPTKLNEYLAMGIPVVATDLPEIRRFNAAHGGVVFVAGTAKEFTQVIREALGDTAPDAVTRRIAVAKKNSWESRLEKMSDVISEGVCARRVTEERWDESLRRLYRSARRRVVRAAVVAASIYALLFHTGFVWLIAEPLKVTVPARQADVIVVFAGGVGESGRAGGGYQERVKEAIDLYAAGRAARVIFSSGYQFAFREAEVMKDLAVDNGLPESAIHLETQASNTFENVSFVDAILKREQWQSVLLVSSPYHMRRALLTWSRVAPEVSVTARPVPTSQFYAHGRGASFEQIKGIVHEYVAIVVYWWRGWI